MTGGPAPAVFVEDLRKSYSGRAVLRGLSFEIRPAEIFALLGPNGAGKTTTVEIIEGYRRPDEGVVRVLGVDPARAGRNHRAKVGLMLQGGGGIDPRMTAREVVGLHARFHADPRPVDALLELVGLTGATARTRYRRLSGGERQRVGLATALVGNPELAILDEPTAGMDVEARAATREVLNGLRSSGVSILVTSHDLADVERLVDRLAILDRGRIVAIGTPAELTSGTLPVLRFRLPVALSDADRLDLAARLDGFGPRPAVVVVEDGATGRYRVEGPAPSPAAIERLAAWCATRDVVIVELRTGGGTLEERYLELVRSGDDEAGAAVGSDGDDVEAVPGSVRRRRSRGDRGLDR